VILFKQMVEIATLPSVARNDITLLEVTAHQQAARDDNLTKPEGEKMPTYDEYFTLFRCCDYGVGRFYE
jgi:hypothetical protein